MFQEAFQATFLGKNSLPRIALSFLNIEINLYFSAVHSSLFLSYILIFLAKIPHPKVLKVLMFVLHPAEESTVVFM